jgi:glycosyltransferase involved in cell wall biosynthesis
MEILVKGDGPLLKDFSSCAKTIVWRNSEKYFNLLPESFKNSFAPLIENQLLKLLLSKQKYDLVYINTATFCNQIRTLYKLAPKLVLHIHELEYALRLLIGNNWKKNQNLLRPVDRVIAVSDSVRNTLIRNCIVSGNKIDLIYGFIKIEGYNRVGFKDLKKEVIKSLGWPEESFVVGSVGSLGWRKGTDVFLQIARHIANKKECNNFRFLWVGGEANSSEALRFNYDCQLLGLKNRCVMIPTTSDVKKFYSSMDVFALVSREDPFPLVVLEAGSYRIPMVCFEASGGGSEFASEGAGLIVPYLDISSFADRLDDLHNSAVLRKEIGEMAYRKVAENFTIEVQGPKIIKTIESCLSSS